MKPEPLTKEKIQILDTEFPMGFKGRIGEGIEEGKETEIKIIFLEDVKSAVQWLLKKIEKERKLMKTEYEEGFTDGYKCACYDITKKIKKAFEGVME